MLPNLPREFLWKNIATMDEMLGDFPGEQLYRIYLILSKSAAMPYDGIRPLKILNEVFYQCTRMLYERVPRIELKDYAQDIKANLGSTRCTKTVIMLMVYLLKMQSDQSDDVKRMISQLKDYFREPGQYYLDMDAEDLILESVVDNREMQSIFLTPTPCAAKDLYGIAIDWHDITQSFSQKAINEILLLWTDKHERLRVLQMIEHAFNYRTITLFEKPPTDMANEDFFARSKATLGLDDDREDGIMWFAAPAEDYREMKEKIALLEKRNASLESENQRLKSELNMTKKKERQERSFTLKMMVDYCKNKPSYEYVEHIVAMLYKFIRNGTDEEQALVDSIDEEFVNRKCGNNFNGPVGQIIQYADKIETQSK